MRDYKPYIGREVSVMTVDGTFQGELLGVGRHSLTIKPEAMYDPDGRPAPTPKGVIVVEQFAISFVQVR